MKSKVILKNRPDGEMEQWLAKHIGPRMHWMAQSVGGQGWIAKSKTIDNPGYEFDAISKHRYAIKRRTVWELTFEDDRYATWFGLMFSDQIYNV